MKKEQKKEGKNLGRQKSRGRERTKKGGKRQLLFRVRAENASREWELGLAGGLLSFRFYRAMKAAPPFPAPPKQGLEVCSGDGGAVGAKERRKHRFLF